MSKQANKATLLSTCLQAQKYGYNSYFCMKHKDIRNLYYDDSYIIYYWPVGI